MNIAQRKQAEIKARQAKGEKVTVKAPDYNRVSRAVGGTIATRKQQQKLQQLQQQKRDHNNQQLGQTESQQFDIIKAALEGDLVTLKSIKTVKEKLAYKAHVLPGYLDYLQQYEQAGHNHPNVVLSQAVVWLFDTEQFELAQKYADLAIAQGQKLPPRFNTPNFETFICDELCDYAARQFSNKKPAPALQYAVEGVLDGWNVNKIVSGKVLAMAGKLANAAGDTQQAYDYCARALEFNDRAGVKKLLNDLTSRLAAEQAAQQAGQQGKGA